MAQANVSLQGCLLTAMILLMGTTVHPLVSLILIMEMSIYGFFFIIYTFAIQRYLPYILWPISVSEGTARLVCVHACQQSRISLPIFMPMFRLSIFGWGWGRGS